MMKPRRVRTSPSTRDTEEEESEETSEETRLAELGSRIPEHRHVNTKSGIEKGAFSSSFSCHDWSPIPYLCNVSASASHSPGSK